ncbi:hypothetical protein ALO61_102451 [Pseudomonas savastanoi pv. nerii]|uniref:Uncharacterized protein n=3 Tax=Pseudomonas syringae group TaxID=136849 RepID=A0A0P9QY35_PSEA0|nr:hypothetical protein ALO78_102335 [Pseudomonas amygdali pv. ciccaronei]KPX13025.1 hypothetical protein ALO73_102813 [Pseudomonas syringae pv. daphniphylli]KPX34500.1 hypothetical protein ALO70_102590 [Pseudomonas amygdali pv. eriobotryae]KPX97592.1 hypothetical protein ALO62_103055 [Pseudomonas amygdali pv. myricae]KPY01439.1 hypothetical protein ALO61_102451 [Pseudomonas savastanoi pv. nerii]KPY41082.1 hypothetical protein ALO48_102386 [Pseudomonas syringae pv. rhaphiolepidis]KPY45257.1 h
MILMIPRAVPSKADILTVPTGMKRRRRNLEQKPENFYDDGQNGGGRKKERQP